MFRIIGLFLAINWATGESIVFEESGRHRVIYDNTNKPVKKPTISPNTVDNIFQIPIAVIEGTSSAAQSWYPENGGTINKVFDIPVQTLQAISSLVKDRLTQETKSENNRRIEKKIGEENEQSDDYEIRKRHAYLGWDFPLVDLFFGHDQGHHGHHGHKKKKRKPYNLNGHFGSHGHFGHHGHFGNHNSNSNIGQPILGGDGNIYHVTETLDDAIQIGPWKPYTGIIQNKIAPGSRFRF